MKKWLLAGGCAVLVFALSLALAAQVRRARAAEHTLAESMLAALADSAEEVEALALSVDKLGVATSPTQQAALLHDAVLSADRARHSLTLLPTAQENAAPVLAFLSRLSGTAGELLTRLGAGLPVTDGEMLSFTSAKGDLSLLHAEMSLALSALLEGEDISSALPPSAIAPSPSAAELAAYRALPSAAVGSGEALHIAREFVGDSRVTAISSAPNTIGALPTYGVTVQTRDVQLNLEITQRGGKVLLMSPETAGFLMTKTVDECRLAASDFLTNRGFASMSAAYYQIYDGLCVLTFAHEQEEALVWPDRVTVQVRMDTAEVVGLEARSYWKNHTPRKLGAPLLTAEEASAALSPAAETESTRLAVILSGGQERLCWQFTVTHNDDRYVCFIDATTGRELLLEKVMQLEYGAVPA
ncbi:MAG: germination protein YpeB [Clostridia bacterium]|nr:germination protein YpeB [Clostridia bacterium]